MKSLTAPNKDSERSLRSQQSYKDGKTAEQMAVQYLASKGYRILVTNYKTSHGEIDILAIRCHAKLVANGIDERLINNGENSGTLVVCEVKTRKNQADLFYTIQTKQRLRIQNALLFFLSENETYNNWQIRFDAVFVDLKQHKITHIIDAWDYNVE